MTAYTFHADLIVQGYHGYQSIRDNPLADGGLLCERETRNLHDLQAMAIKKMYPASCWVRANKNIFNFFDILEQVAVLHSRETFL